MKKFISILLLLAFILSILASCDAGGKANNDNSVKNDGADKANQGEGQNPGEQATERL